MFVNYIFFANKLISLLQANQERTAYTSSPTSPLATIEDPSSADLIQLDNDNVAAVTALALLLVERAGDGDREAALNLLERIPESPETRRVAAMVRIEPVEDIEASLADLLGTVKEDDDSRRRFVDLLELLGPDDPRTADWRRRLTSALF